MSPSSVRCRIDAYRSAKLRERERLLGELRAWEATDPDLRGLKAGKPRRTWLTLDEVRDLLAAADPHRALLATMILGGLRVGELCALRWRAVDLARGSLVVEESKTDAGTGRTVDLSPDLLGELKKHKAGSPWAEPDDLVFPTRRGTRRDRSHVRSRVLLRAVARANAANAEAGRPPIQKGVTNHTLRRTFASLLYEAGASPAYVMSQLGHEGAALALEVYAKVMERTRDTGARMDDLIRSGAPDWDPETAESGRNGAEEPWSFSPDEAKRRS
jgi:integrase